MTATYTTAEVAERLRCSVRKVRNQASSLGIGIALGGRSGYRYTAAEVDRLIDSMRPTQPVGRRRKRRT